MKMQELATRADAAEQLLRSLANRWRLMIMCELIGGEMSVSELQARLGLSQSALSQHLAKLRAERLVSTRREVNSIYYAVGSSDVLKVIALLNDLFCARGETGKRRPRSCG